MYYMIGLSAPAQPGVEERLILSELPSSSTMETDVFKVVVDANSNDAPRAAGVVPNEAGSDAAGPLENNRQPVAAAAAASSSRAQSVEETGPINVSIRPCCSPVQDAISRMPVNIGRTSRSKVTSRQRTRKPKDRSFPCYVCDAKFAQSANVVTHIRVKHPGNNRYICFYCSNNFATIVELRNHKKTCDLFRQNRPLAQRKRGEPLRVDNSAGTSTGQS